MRLRPVKKRQLLPGVIDAGSGGCMIAASDWRRVRILYDFREC